MGASNRVADAADALLPEPDVRAHQCRVVADVLRDVRLNLPAYAVLPDGAALFASPVGAPDPALDCDADLRCADRWGPLRPHRRAALHDRRPCPPGDRTRLDRGRQFADRLVLLARLAIHSFRHRPGVLLPPPCEPRPAVPAAPA